MQASGSAEFVGHAADRPAAETARTLEARDRHEPLRASRFTVELDGTEVEGFRTIDLPQRYSSSESGGEGPGQSRHGLLEGRREMKKGDNLLDDWRTAVEAGRRDEGGKDLVVSLLNDTVQTAHRWRFSNSWPTEYAPPTLDTEADGEIAVEAVTVDFDGVERFVDSGPVHQTHVDSGVFRYVRTANDGRVDTGAQSFETAFGSSVEATADGVLDVQAAQAGDTVDPATTMFGVLAPAIRPFNTPSIQVRGAGPQQLSALFDAGCPAPLAGATFGLVTFSTPSASVAGQSVNPLVRMETLKLLKHDITRQVLGKADVSDVETVEWLDGPHPISFDGPPLSTQMLGIRTQIESLHGVVVGEDGPWHVGVHVARITDDSHVIAAGVHRYPLGTVGGFGETIGWQQSATRARNFTAVTAEQLEYL